MYIETFILFSFEPFLVKYILKMSTINHLIVIEIKSFNYSF